MGYSELHSWLISLFESQIQFKINALSLSFSSFVCFLAGTQAFSGGMTLSLSYYELSMHLYMYLS